MKTNSNPLLCIDVYKAGHMRFYKPGTTKVYSYLCARSTKKSEYALFFGLQPILKFLETKITQDNANEFFIYWKEILGSEVPKDVVEKIQSLVELGYIPLEIKAVPEGTVIGNKNVLATVTNSIEGYFWVVGFFESLLLKVWNTTSVATLSHKFKRVATKFTQETSDSDFLLPFLVHDFGYRGVSSEQTAELAGSAHLVNFCGTDTVPAIKFMKENYSGSGLIGASVPASEHSIHQSFGPTEQDELDYVNNMIDLNPTGLVSVVSDAYDYWRMLTVTLPKVKDKILARDGKYVVRPDSGDPLNILCGDAVQLKSTDNLEDELYNYPYNNIFEQNGIFYKKEYNEERDIFEAVETKPSPSNLGTFRILEELFGATVNSKGYKELNAKVGVIYGDGMYYERYVHILETMKNMGYANTNLVIGIGGLLLQQHNRDDLGFAFKATYAEINGVAVELYKDPATDPGKRSHKGLMKLENINGVYVTKDQQSDDNGGELVTVFKDGKVVKEYTLEEIRERAKV